jgi:hypothetical protein
MKFFARLLIFAALFLSVYAAARNLRGQLEKMLEPSEEEDEENAVSPHVDAVDGDDYFEELDKKADDNFYTSGDSEDADSVYVDDSHDEDDEEDEEDEDGSETDDAHGDDDKEEEMRRQLQEKFNVFKSYANSPRKPPQYSKQTIKHDIREYLSQNQQYMLKNRNVENGPDMFDSSWSGLHNHNKG